MTHTKTIRNLIIFAISIILLPWLGVWLDLQSGNDPHNQELSQVGFQEYEHNTTHMKDRLLLAAIRIVAGWPKMPGERECYARYMSDWIKH